MRLGKLRIRRERPGVIAPGRCWVAVHEDYLYTHLRLTGLIWLLVTEWKKDRHLVGLLNQVAVSLPNADVKKL